MNRWFLDRVYGNKENVALIHSGTEYSYADVLARATSIDTSDKFSSYVGGVSLEYYARLLFSIFHNKIFVPVSGISELDEVTQYLIDNNPLVRKPDNSPGLVLVTSGTTGKKKVALHNLGLMLNRFSRPMTPRRVLSMLLPDHIGGINTILYTICCGGSLVVPDGRDVESICQAIEKYGVEILPASPSLLNAILISNGYNRYDLSSLGLITYGTEPMPQSTLDAVHRCFPDARLLQTYGSSEVGIVKTKSEKDNSLWLKIGDAETKIVDSVLWVRSPYSMIGYLDRETEISDGWINTHDIVEERNGYIKFSGRDSDVINVGGLKVFPVEIEDVIREIEGIDDVVVWGEANFLTGQVVYAKVKTELSEEKARQIVEKYCCEKLERYKRPVRIIVTADYLYGERYKKGRVPHD